MIGRSLWRKRPTGVGRALCDAAVRQARAPAIFAAMGAPDTVEGRFEVLTLHVILLIEALGDLGSEAAPTRQALFDAYLSDLDGALREMGVGDLSVGRRMRALGQAFYGRAAAWRDAFASLPDRSGLENLVWRTVLAEREGADPAPLANYAVSCREALMTLGARLLEGVAWPGP